jgi:transcriptional regulator with XRE-family HTH domain
MPSLRELRNQRGLTQAQAAEKIGVSNVTLGKWENGKSTPTDDTIARLAEIYAIAPTEIELRRNGHYQSEVVSEASIPEGTSDVIQLSAGTITLTSTVNFLALSRDERRLVVNLLDALDELKTATNA